MNKQEIVDGLNGFHERLINEVVQAYEQRGYSFGNDRFKTWQRKFAQFLDQHLPGESSTLNNKLTHYSFVSIRNETDSQRFWRQDGENMISYIDSLIIDVNNDEYDLPEQEKEVTKENTTKRQSDIDQKRIFIVHGHDGEAKDKTARFIEKLGFEPIILSEQANRGLTIIEKIEKHSNVGFAIVLYTPDDLGNTQAEATSGNLLSRARQNVIFEHGLLIGKIGRENVVPLVADTLEIPSDISGVVYISNKDWQMDIAKEMKAAGYYIDFNKLL